MVRCGSDNVIVFVQFLPNWDFVHGPNLLSNKHFCKPMGIVSRCARTFHKHVVLYRNSTVLHSQQTDEVLTASMTGQEITKAFTLFRTKGPAGMQLACHAY